MSRSPHVCIVTTAHAVDDMRVRHKMAAAFRAAGFRVSWVGPGHAAFGTSGDERDGIAFTLSRPIRSRWDRLLAPLRIGRLARTVRDVDAYYAPEPDSAAVAIRLARRTGARVVFDIHEIYHGALLDRWLPGRRCQGIREFVRRRIARLCVRSDLVVGVSTTVVAAYAPRPEEHLVVRSCAPDWFADGPPAAVCAAGRSTFTLMHGRSHASRGTEVVLDAISRVAPRAANVRVIMTVPGGTRDNPEATALAAAAAARGIGDRLDLHPVAPLRQWRELLRSCDVGLVAYGRDLGIDSLPNRLFEYMALGIPVIAPGYAVEIARIVQSEGCGLLVDFEDAAAVADAILTLQRDPVMCRAMGSRARAAFLARHNWSVEVRPLLDRIRSWAPTGT